MWPFAPPRGPRVRPDRGRPWARHVVGSRGDWRHISYPTEWPLHDIATRPRLEVKAVRCGMTIREQAAVRVQRLRSRDLAKVDLNDLLPPAPTDPPPLDAAVTG